MSTSTSEPTAAMIASMQQQPSRSIQACLECRKSKLKCDGMTKQDSVCTRCRKRGRTCHWSVHLPFTGSEGGATSIQPGPSVSAEENYANHTASLPSVLPNPGTAPYRHTSFNDSSPYNASTAESSNVPYPHPYKRVAERHHEHPPSSRRRISPSWPTSPAANETNDSPSSLDSPEDVTPSTNPAPLVAIREVALLSPEEEKVDGFPNGRAYENSSAQGGHDSFAGTRAQHEAVLAEMDGLQGQSGWTKSALAGISAERRHFFERAIAGEPDSIRQLDPLEQGVITMNDAERYFEVYYESINSQHCLLDPVQDTWQAVRNRSRALFITVVAAASCIDIRQTSIGRRTSLTRNMDDAIALILMANAKSPDVVKALLLAYLFTQKPDRVSGDKCWLLVDTASRTAAELGLGIRLRTPQASVTNSDTYSFRNAERAWIFSQVMQRSLGTSTGLWSIGKMDVKWDKLEAWCECRDALPGDVEHVAFLFLRRLEYHARSQFEDIDAERFSTLESIRASFNALFDNWRQRWVEHPKLAKEHISRSFLLIVGLHIQLLINVTALKLAEGSKGRRTDFSRDMSPDLQPFCIRIAVDLCQTFITCFKGKAHTLCRNIVSMVTWSAMALLQMEAEKGRMLVLRVALMLAGQANDLEYRTTLSAFFGRSLLSLVNDLTISGSQRRHPRHGLDGHHVHREGHHHRDGHSHARGEYGTRTGAPPSHLFISSGGGGGGSSARSTTGSTTSLHTPTSSVMHEARGGGGGGGVQDPNRDHGGHGSQLISAERMLSTMAGPLSADPYNEQWLNQFLDNLAPPIALPAEYGAGGAPGPSAASANGFTFSAANTGSNTGLGGGGQMFANRGVY